MSIAKSLRSKQKALGQRIRDLRLGKGWSSQDSFAAACSLNRVYLGQVERGEANVTLSTLATITEKLEIPISELFKGIA